jgi:iron complex transport system ATP-binding protein
MSSIKTIDLSIGYRRGKSECVVQKNLSLNAPQGELIALIGPNGCGKSTLLRTLAGLQEPVCGDVMWGENGGFLKEMRPHERAKTVGLVLTEPVQLGFATVEQIVAMGRHPYTSFSGKLTAKDRKIVDVAISAVHLDSFRHRLASELSDGERQRVMIAKALAQDTPIVLLDEPTSFLDLPNRVEIMVLLQKMAHEMNKCVLLSTHEIDLAIRLADVLWLMMPEKGIRSGSAKELSSDGSLQSVFKGDSFGFDPVTGRVIIF